MGLTQSSEYDQFGPWILKVASASDVPRVFRDYSFGFDVAEIVLKLPRDIVRRDATPDMHLYDSMLIVDDTALTLLTRAGDEFTTSAIRIGTIAAVEQSVELLDGLLSVHGTNGTTVHVPYNSASSTIINAVATRLLQLTGAATDHGADSEPMPIDALGVRDIALTNAYSEAALSTSGLRVRAAYAATSPSSTESFLNRIRKGRVHLSGAVICENDSQLIVLSRRVWIRYRGKPDLSTKRTVIVRARVTNTDISVTPLVRDANTITISLGAAKLEFVVPANGDAVRALTRH